MDEPTQNTGPGPDEADSVAFSWAMYHAIREWIAMIDTKASIVLSLETALLGLVIALARPPAGQVRVFYYTGAGLLLVAIMLAGGAVFPQLSRRFLRRWRGGFSIYFGQLRRWQPDELASALIAASARQRVRTIADDVVAISVIAWRKHTLIQGSMMIGFVACLLMMVAR